MISFADARRYFGPNPYASDPVIVFNLRIDQAGDPDLETHAARMTDAFGTWWSGTTRRPEESMELFVARYLVEWSLAALNEVRGFIHSGGARQTDDGIVLWLGFHDPDLAPECLSLAAKFFVVAGRSPLNGEQVNQIMANFWEKCRNFHPDYQAKILMEAARARNLPWLPFFQRLKVWQFGWGCRSIRFFESSPEEDSATGARIAGDKVLSKFYLHSMGAPVSTHMLVNDVNDLPGVVEKIGWPCVVKPIDRGQARGVSVNIRDAKELRQAFAKARDASAAPIMIESHVEGDVHRLLVVRGKFVAATRRDPAEVIGDGRSTILALGEAFNQARTATATPGSYLGPVPFDEDFDSALAKQGYSRDSVPEAGTKVRLRTIPLQGTGAENTEVSHLVHPDIKFIVEALAESLCLKVVGFDYLTPDISRSYQEMGKFLEINLCPSLRGHLVDDRDVRGIADIILGPKPARIPSMLIIASRQEAERYGNELSAQPGLAWRCGSSAGVGSARLLIDARDPVKATQSLLINAAVSRIVVICTPEELASVGMPMDRVDVVMVDDGKVDSAWLDVLRRHSAEFIPLAAPEDLKQIVGQRLPQPAL